MTKSTRLHPDSPDESSDDAAISRRLDAHDSAIAAIQASLATILAKLDQLGSSVAISGATSSSASLLGRPPSVDPPPPPPPLVGRPPLSLDIPSFAGIDPMGWIAKAEQYFDLHQTGEQDKVATVFVGLDGSALHWARWLRQTSPLLTWADLKHEMIRRYDSRYAGSAIERLCGVRQTASLDDYIDEFVALVTHVPGLPPEHYLAFFMQGLLPPLRSRLRTHHPRSVSEAIDMTRLVEADLGTPPATVHASSYEPRPTWRPPSSAPPWRPPPTAPPPRPPGPEAPPVRPPTPFRLSNDDYNDLRNRGLCFRCRQPYAPNHRCGVKEFHVMIGDPDPGITAADFEALELPDTGDPSALDRVPLHGLPPPDPQLRP